MIRRLATRHLSFNRLAIAFALSLIASHYAVVMLPIVRAADVGVAGAQAAAMPDWSESAAPARNVFEEFIAPAMSPLETEARNQAQALLAELPAELFEPSAAHKVSFVEAALPLVLSVNAAITADRARLVSLRDRLARGEDLPAGDTAWLEARSRQYGLDTVDFPELLRRMDVIPPSLALAQAAEESGWGTSRYAVEGNALFGQRVWEGSDGLVPRDRPEGETYRIASFDRLLDAVWSYARNLNSHAAYDKFRRLRETARQENGRLDGYALAAALDRYSERGKAYIRGTIRKTIIRGNGFAVLDDPAPGPRVLVDARDRPEPY